MITRGESAFAAGTLWSRVVGQAAKARRSAALHTIRTRYTYVDDGGVRFVIRVVANLTRKSRARMADAGTRADDPFLVPEPDLLVADIAPHHRAVLNKFNVVEHHLLLVTRAFEDQCRLLTAADFAALWSCLGEYPSLGFYNAGQEAGASQSHKHMQLVPLPLAPEGPAVPIAPWLEKVRYRSGIGSMPGLACRHAVADLRDLVPGDPRVMATRLRERYASLLVETGLGHPPGKRNQGEPYNLLITREWMLMVPRSRECWEGVSINALGYAGALLVRDRDQLRRLRLAGPRRVLAAAGMPTSAPADSRLAMGEQ